MGITVRQIDPSRVGSAYSHEGSLVGKEVNASKKEGADSQKAYRGLNPEVTYKVISDDEAKTFASDVRTICIEDKGGNKACGSATGFDVKY